MKKIVLEIILIILIIAVLGTLLIYLKQLKENPKDNSTANNICDINNIISKFNGASGVDRINMGYDGDFVLRCNYQGQDVYYFGVGCCDRVTHIYDNGCNDLGSEGGLAGGTRGNFTNISNNMKNCSILWIYPDEQNRSLTLTNSVLNRTISS